MKIHVSKNGKVLGEFEGNTILRNIANGEWSRTDTGWKDGISDWKTLGELLNIGTAAPPNTNEPPTERVLWKGSPSRLLLTKAFLVWLFIIVLCAIFIPIFTQAKEWPLIPIVLIGCLDFSIRYLKLKSVRYTFTNQHARIERGIFSKDLQEIELFRVEDTVAHQPFLMLIFGIGNLRILSGDHKNPNLFFHAIPKPISLREELRSEVLALRQRMGVRQLDVI